MTDSHSTAPFCALVLCAGKGTRMKSALPKVLHRAAGKSIGSWVISAAQGAGSSSVIAVVGHLAEQTQAGLQAQSDEGLLFALQREQKGTGHAVMQAIESVPSDAQNVLILYGDTPLVSAEALGDLVRLHAEQNALCSLWVTTPESPEGYGRIVRDEAGQVKGIVEQKDCSDAERLITETNPGIYMVDAAFLRSALKKLTPENAQGELYLTDIVALAYEQKRVASLVVDAEITLGVNDRTQLAQASAHLYEKIRKRAMQEGATLLDPASVYIDEGVAIGQDVIIEPNVHLRGESMIHDDVRLGTGSVVQDSVIAKGAVLLPYSMCDKAHVGEGASIGPFARLRPASDVREGAKVGNFVEMKNTRLGKGSKASHLSYLGDAQIAEGCNIGAGTITCNYDGFGKHLTQLDEGVFVGSNSTLVAPLHIEKNAYVAAGSTLTKGVVEDSLAIARARQDSKAGYAKHIRERFSAQAAAAKKNKQS